MNVAAGVVGAHELIEALPLAVVLLDADLRIAGWNGPAELLYGRSRAEVLGRPAAELLFDVDDRARARAVLADAAAGRPWTGDFRVCRGDGVLLVSAFRAVAVGELGHVAWIATDPGDLGAAEEERSVRMSAEHAARAVAEDALGLVEAIIAAAPVGIAVFDLQLRYVRVNDAYAALSGISAADHIGGRLGDVVPLPPEVNADLRRVVTTGRAILGRHVEVEPWGPAENVRHFDVSYFPVRSTGGTLVGAGTTVVDVTEAKRAEVERVELLRRAEDAQRRLAILATASTVLATTMELEELLRRLARTLTPGAADWCIIQLLGPRGQADHLAVSHRDRAVADELAAFLRSHPLHTDGEGPIAQALRTGQARLLPTTVIAGAMGQAAIDRGRPEIASRFDVNSSVVVPIEGRGETLGVLLLSTDGERVLGDDDLDLAVEIAHRTALAVGNARAFQHEHHVAESLQRALLPATVPAAPGLSIAVRYLAATDGVSVGGDWYDVMSFDDGTVGVVVGDVIGHDIAASTAMGQLRSALRAYAGEDHRDPGATIARVDKVFDVLGLTYATCIFGVVDVDAGRFRWSNGGHPPPLLLHNGQPTFLLEGNGVLLGVTGGAGASSATTTVSPGDVLVLYTDGLIERRSESLADGLARLAAAAANLISVRDPETISDALLAALLPAGHVRDDDVAMLVLRIDHEHAPHDRFHLDLDAAPESVAVARGFLAGVLESAGRHHHVDTAVLLVSELVTNAIRHGQPPYSMTITIESDLVEVSVEDGADHDLPSVKQPEQLSDGGRGLLLVSGLASDWGVRRSPVSKATWFRLRER